MEELKKLSNIANNFEKNGNYEFGKIITEAMRKIAEEIPHLPTDIRQKAEMLRRMMQENGIPEENLWSVDKYEEEMMKNLEETSDEETSDEETREEIIENIKLSFKSSINSLTEGLDGISNSINGMKALSIYGNQIELIKRSGAEIQNATIKLAKVYSDILDIILHKSPEKPKLRLI
jgi:hypothetical protein